MPKLEEAPKFEKSAIPVGKHILTLTAIRNHESPNTFPDARKELNAQTGEWEVAPRKEWIWEFKSATIDPVHKKPYEFSVFTPRFYNGASTTNKLTLLMRQLAPESTDEERKAMIEMDHLIGRKWTARLVTATSKNGKEFTTYNSFEPIEDEGTRFDPESVKDDGIPFSVEAVGTETPAVSQAVSDEVKSALGKAMLAVALDDVSREKFKADLLVKLGQLRYSSYADFVANGQKDALKVLLFVQSWGVPA